MTAATCHPTRERWARGLCTTCYRSDYTARTGNRQPSGRRTTEQNRLKQQQRRAAMHQVAFEPVTVQAIALRDGWTCWLCSRPIDPVAPWPTPGYPTLDHVVPISRQGPHTAANLRLAHHGCNSRRRAGPPGGPSETLALAGSGPAPKPLSHSARITRSQTHDASHSRAESAGA